MSEAHATATTTAATYTQDEYGVVSNSPGTYAAAAKELQNTGAVSLGWTDNEMSHLDVLLVLAPWQVGPKNRMDNTSSKMFIGVAGHGMFGFRTRADDPIHPAYLAQKLGIPPSSVTADRLADLFNGVMAALAVSR